MRRTIIEELLNLGAMTLLVAGCTVNDGTSCSVTENDDGTSTIECEDGTSSVLQNGKDGEDGKDGFECLCEAGYEGDGRECTSLCPSGCSDDSTGSGGELHCVCNDGYEGDGITCTDVNECSQGLHDCVSPAVCVNEPGAFSCVCPGALELQGTNACACPGAQVLCDGACIDPSTDAQYCGASGTCAGASAGTACTLGRSCVEGECHYPVPQNVLVLTDTPTPILAALAHIGVDDVVETSPDTFVTDYDAQEWDLLIVDISSGGLSSARQAVSARAGGGKLIFNYWALNQDADLQTAFGVSCESITSPPELAPLASVPVDLFALRETFPAPLVPSHDGWNDNGDVLTLTGAGDALVSRHGVTNEAFIVQTNGGSTIVNGFLPSDYVNVDADADGVDDITELFVNEITWLFQ